MEKNFAKERKKKKEKNNRALSKFRYRILHNKSSHPEVLCEKVFLNILQNSQERTCARTSFARLWHACFPVNFVKFVRISFL